VKLYSGPLSLFTAKVRIALAEKQLDYEASLGCRILREPEGFDVGEVM
jgi:hypothetical protein